MSQLHAYIKPRQSGTTYASSFIEVSDDVTKKGIGKLKQRLDLSDYDLGVFRNSTLKVNLRNRRGLYNTPSDSRSIFVNGIRQNSIVKITWEPGSPLCCGFFKPNTGPLSEEITLFEGLLDDTPEISNIQDQEIGFSVLGYETLFDQESVPFGSISNGDLFSDAIFTILNQVSITGILTVTAGNITAGTDQTIDDKTKLENKTVFEALKEILKISNSVLYISGTTVFVKPRTAGATSVFTFYGEQGVGSENITKIQGYRSGVNRMFNFVSWKDATNVKKNTGTISTFGIRKKELGSSLITTSGKIDSILTSVVTEFGSPTQEMRISTPFTVNSLGMFLLDRIKIDYPEVPVAGFGVGLPVYGAAVYGTARYPETLSDFSIDVSRNWKILDRQYDFNNEIATFLVKEIL